jgi:hypothetical protein
MRRRLLGEGSALVHIADGLITAITSVYDSRQVNPASERSLVEAPVG